MLFLALGSIGSLPVPSGFCGCGGLRRLGSGRLYFLIAPKMTVGVAIRHEKAFQYVFHGLSLAIRICSGDAFAFRTHKRSLKRVVQK